MLATLVEKVEVIGREVGSLGAVVAEQISDELEAECVTAARRARWGWLRRHGRGGPEVFIGQATSNGPFTIKVTFFSRRPRDVHGKVRILRFANGTLRDETFRFTVGKPKDVAEIGVFSVE